jgi:hypothetical protein
MDDVTVSEEVINTVMPKITNLSIAIEPITTPSGENIFWNMWQKEIADAK